VYVLLLERMERQVLAEQQMVATLAAAGAKDVEMPVFEQRQALLDELLVAPPARFDADPERAELLTVLGVS
jgi:hypothetical protein